MLATAIIIIREALEAALIIGILAAATRTISGSRRWLAAGELVGSALVGLRRPRNLWLTSVLGEQAGLWLCIFTR